MNKKKFSHKTIMEIDKVNFKIFQAITGLTQSDIAQKIGCTQAFVGMLINGKRKSPKYIDLINKLIKSRLEI